MYVDLDCLPVGHHLRSSQLISFCVSCPWFLDLRSTTQLLSAKSSLSSGSRDRTIQLYTSKKYHFLLAILYDQSQANKLVTGSFLEVLQSHICYWSKKILQFKLLVCRGLNSMSMSVRLQVWTKWWVLYRKYWKWGGITKDFVNLTKFPGFCEKVYCMHVSEVPNLTSVL